METYKVTNSLIASVAATMKSVMHKAGEILRSNYCLNSDKNIQNKPFLYVDFTMCFVRNLTDYMWITYKYIHSKYKLNTHAL